MGTWIYWKLCCTDTVLSVPWVWLHYSTILAMNNWVAYFISVPMSLYCCYDLSLLPRKYWHFKASLTGDINYGTLKMFLFMQGVKAIMSWKKAELPSCLHIPHFLFLGGSEEVDPRLLAPLWPGNTSPKNKIECSKLIEVYIDRMEDFNCQSHWTLSKQ
jgi:hypothetical protein